MNIKDIAQIAGVGVSTVSRVLNEHPDVSQTTRDKVLNIIRENNYIPNNSARVLKQNNTKNIGILVKGVFNPFFSEILKIISVYVQEEGYTMILQHHENDNDIGTLIGFIKEKKLQGAICLGGNFLNLTDDVLAEIDAAIVLVSVDSVTRKNLKQCSSISINNKKAAYMAVNYLIENGHKNIALMLGAHNDYGIGKERQQGYIEALENSQIKINDKYIIYGDYDCEAAYTQTVNLLKENPKITAIFAISDLMAMGAAKAVADVNKKIGYEVSIMGFDGMEFASYYEPTLATIKQPKQVMARKSIDLLFGLLEGKESHQHLFLDVKLIEGGSCQSV